MDEVIGQVKLQDVLGKKIKTLSKGYRQRLGLAATLIGDPEFIVLDEPINGSDPIQINEYRNLIRSISEHKIIVLSSHLLQEIEALCDKVLLLDDGIIKSISTTGDAETLSKLVIECVGTFQSDALNDIEGVEVTNVEKTQNGTRLFITVQDEEDPRTLIFDEFVRQDVKIIEMSFQKSSLDNLFQS